MRCNDCDKLIECGFPVKIVLKSGVEEYIHVCRDCLKERLQQKEE